MKTGDRVIVVNEDSGLFGKTGLIVQHPLGRFPYTGSYTRKFFPPAGVSIFPYILPLDSLPERLRQSPLLMSGDLFR